MIPLNGNRTKPPLLFVNESGEVIPKFAVLKITEVESAGDRDLQADKPNGAADNCTFALNIGRQVASGGNGTCTNAYGAWALYDDANTPQPGEEWGPDSDWLLHKGKSGYIIVGGAESFTVGMTTYNRVRVKPSGGSSGNIIYAQVVSNVADSDPTGDFYNAVGPYVGSIPSGGTGTFQNINGEEFLADQWVKFFQRKDTLEWHPERGGTAGTIVLRFETTAAKDWDATTVGGVILDATDTPVGDPITLTDRGPAKHEALVGSRGWCVRNGDDDYWIITMDSPARWVEGTLTANWELDDDHQTITVTDWWGAAPNHLEPETSTVDIYDNILVRSRKYFTGEKFRALWDETLKLYVTNNTPGDFITIKGTTGSVSRSDGSFTLAEVVGVNGQVPTGTITVTNDPPINTPGGRTVYARFNYSIGTNLQTAWDTGDGGNILLHLRGLADWNGSVQQPLDHDADGDPHWHGSAPCTPPE